MHVIELPAGRFEVTRATAADVPAIVALLTADELGRTREGAETAAYVAAFHRIDADPAHLLVAVKDDSSVVVGTMQLTLLPGLARRAATRLQLESVHVAAAVAGMGLGTALFAWAHDYGRSQGAALAQLTTDKSRRDAHRFYARLGYEASHEGMKLAL